MTRRDDLNHALHHASLGEIFNVWAPLCDDVEAISDNTPAAVVAVLHDDLEQVRDELRHRMHLARLASKLNPAHDGAILPLPRSVIRELLDQVFPP